MDHNFRMKIILLFIAISTCTSQNPDLCPFQCNCSGKTVTCKGLNQFPTGLPSNTEELVFDVSSFDNFQQNALKSLTRLNTFRVMNSNLTNIHPCTISNLKNMKKLEFSNINIGQIVSNGFSHLSDIDEIILTNITIQKLHSYAFNDIRNVNKLTMDRVVISKMEQYGFHSWSNIRYVQFHWFTVLSVKSRPFQEFKDIDQFDVMNGIFPSSMCGLKDILQKESVKKIVLHNNKIRCNCNTLWVFEIKRNSKDIDVKNNTCLSSHNDIMSEENKSLCSSHELPECPGGQSTKKVQNCQTYKLDEPIMPLETVPYPKSDENNHGAKMELPWFFISILFLMMYVL